MVPCLECACEFFQSHVVSDASVTEHSDLGIISVSTELVDADRRCQTRRRPGVTPDHEARVGSGWCWSLVGLDQTDESIIMPRFTWPCKKIAVLGTESVPMDILRLLDPTVEIAQLGIIRLLNVLLSRPLAVSSFIDGGSVA